MVAVGIVAVLAMVVIGNVQGGRKKAHDAQRMSDIKQIQLALRLYKDANDGYPSGYNDGVVIGANPAFDAEMASYLPSTLKDPLALIDSKWSMPMIETAWAVGGGGPPKIINGDYGYIYDSSYDDCSNPSVGTGKKVLYVKTMELPASSNWVEICGLPFPDQGVNSNAYGVILE
jgi:hypothetical protein